jgi:hypothetical protein
MPDLKGSLAVSVGTCSALNWDLSSRLGVAPASELCPRILLTKPSSSLPD